MKKFTLTLAIAVFALFAFSQEKLAIPSGQIIDGFDFSKANDTLAPLSFATGTLTYYITFCGIDPEPPDTGFVVGPNCYGDLAKAQQFLYEGTPYNLIGCLVWVAKHRGSAGSVTFNVHSSNGTGTADSGPVNYAPGTILSSATKNYSDFVSGLSFAEGMNYFELATPLAISDDYYVALDFASMGAYPANAFAIVSSSDGDASGTEMSWEQWDNAAWYSFVAAWPLDFDIMFFPIITEGSSVQEHFINNVILNIYPNPVSEVATIEYELKNSAKDVNIGVLDITGKKITSFEMGAQFAGSYSVSFDASELPAGTYIYVIQADRNRLAKQFIVQ